MSDELEQTVKSNPWEPSRSSGPVSRQRRGPSAAPESAASLQAPQAKVALPSPFEFEGTLGRGGMGVVYLATDTTQNRKVAIKFLSSTGQDASLAKRFQREASQLAQLHHPNIVGFYDAGYFQKQNYIVMEYVPGGSLRGLLAQQEGPLTLQQSLELFAGVADGLEYIHQSGLVHRDLKPDNILLGEDRHPKIGDFGLALKLEDQSRITQSGMILGTYSYLSPEQILSRDVGPSADLYALGCCMYEAITGRPLFSADTEFALLNSHLRQTPIPPRQVRLDIPAELDTLILRLLQKSPGERPDSAAEVAKTLRRLQQSLRQVWSLPVVGRDEILHQLEQHLRPCLLRQPVGVLLTAPPGLGRSCLVRQLVTQLQRASIAVHPLVPLPYQLEPTAALFQELGGSNDAWLEALSQGGPEAAAGLLWKQLEGLGAPRVLVIDDLLRQPPTSNAVIEALCGQTPPPGLGWLISCASHRASSLRAWDGAVRVELGPLDDQALRDVAHLQVSGHLDDELSEGLLFRSAGSVRRLRLWLLALRGAGLLQRQGQMLQRDPGQPWPESLWEPLWLQISARPENEVKLLRIAGLLDEPFPYELIQQLSELDEVEAHGALDLLLRDGLLEECWGQPGELYQFSSKELKDKLQASSTDRLKRRVYARAAHLLEGKASVAILAQYLRRAGNEAEALPKFLQAACEAEQTGDLVQAENNWSQALSVCGPSGTPEIRLMALVGRAETLLKMGRLSEVDSTAGAELGRPLPDSAELKRTRRHLAGLVARSRWLREQRGADLLEFCQSELDQLAASDFSDSLWLTWCWAGYLMEEGAPAQGLEILNRLPELDTYPAPYYWLKASLMRSLGRAQEAEAVLKGCLESPAPRTGAEEVELFLELALVQVQLGKTADEQGRWLDQAVGRAHQLGDMTLLAEIEWVRGLLHEVQHDLGAALRSYQRVIEASQTGNSWRSQGYLQMGVGLAKLDRLDEAERALQQGLDLEPPLLLDQLHLAQGAVQLQRGDWERAREAFASAERHNGGPSARMMRCWCLFLLDQKEVATNLLESIEELGDPLEKWLRQRLIKLQQQVPEPWPGPEEQPWILQGHPLRGILMRLVPPTQRRETILMPVAPAHLQPAEEAAPARRSLAPLVWVGGLALAALIGLGLRPLIWKNSQPTASPTPVPSVSTSTSATPSPLAVTTPSPTPTPSPSPTFVPPSPARLELSVTPPITGEVRLNGKKIPLVKGKLSESVAPGSYHLEISAAGYKTEERDLTLGEGEVLPSSVEMTRLTGKVEVKTVPANCRIYQVVGNKMIGKSIGGKWLSGDLPVGRLKLKAVRDGYQSQTKEIQIKAEQNVSLRFTLERNPEPVYVAPAPQPYYPPAPAPYYPPAPAPYYPPPPPPADPYKF
ncbi:protein kinase [bacterium]|nr:protein kinase [bacterium]